MAGQKIQNCGVRDGGYQKGAVEVTENQLINILINVHTDIITVNNSIYYI